MSNKLPITIKDVAIKANVSIGTAYQCLKEDSRYSNDTIKKVRKAASELGYKIASKAASPANKMFASREAETSAMTKLRMEGYSNEQISEKCGVSRITVERRIGNQPTMITAANRKLAATVRSTQAKMRLAYQRTNVINEYNKKVVEYNKQLKVLSETKTELDKMHESANTAARLMRVKLNKIDVA